MLAQQRQGRRARSAIGNNVECRTLRAARFDVLRRHIRRIVQPEHHHPAVKVAPKLRHIFVVGIEYRDAAGMQRLDQLILGASDAGNRLEELQVYRRDHGHHSAVGLPPAWPAR